MRGNFLFKEHRNKQIVVEPNVQLDKLGDIFLELGMELQQSPETQADQMQALQQMYQRVYGQVCLFCSKQILCWQEDVDLTCEEFARACNQLDQQGLQEQSVFSSRFQGRCAKTGRLEIALYNQMEQYQQQNSLQVLQSKAQNSVAAHLIGIGQQLKQQEAAITEPEEEYQLLLGYATAEHEGHRLSGDSWGTQELSQGRTMQILSDGMGSGEAANQQSRTTVHLLQVLLAGGLTLSLSLQIINTVLSLRFEGERFATVDLAIWNVPQQKIEFFKLGATPSFIKNGKRVLTYGGPSLPLGILPEVESNRQEHALREGDLLIMMSDGLYEMNEPDIFQWEEVISCLPTDDPQLAAEYLLAIASSRCGRKIKDDLTVLVSCLGKNEDTSFLK